jgi:hypothetical protein
MIEVATTPREARQQMRIIERPSRNGEFRTLCPQCSHKRKKKRDPCLAVKIDSLGVQWHCFNCPDMSGGQYFDGTKDSRNDWRGGHGAARAQPRNRRPIGHLYR